MPRITKDNYGKWVTRMEREIERARRTPGHEDMERVLTEGIGNLHWEFGSFEKAQPYYDRAIALLRGQQKRPSSSVVAMMYWKAGRLREMHEECRAIIANRTAELPEVEARKETDEGRRELMLVYLHLAKAAFLLGDYAAAQEWAEKAMPLQAYGPSDLNALHALASSLKLGDRQAFEAALRSLREITRPWPTFESVPTAELLRFALYLGREHFGSVPEDLATEQLDSGKWDAFREFAGSSAR